MRGIFCVRARPLGSSSDGKQETVHGVFESHLAVAQNEVLRDKLIGADTMRRSF